MAIVSYTAVGIDSAISSGTAVVGSGTAHTKGSWVELTASSAVTASAVIVQITYAFGNTVTDDFLIDIGTGAMGAESAVIANLYVSAGSIRGGRSQYYCPIAIASGTRIAARCQQDSTSTSQIFAVSLLLVAATETGASNCQTYGADTATTRGTTVDPGASPNTKGAYSELSASTSADCNGLLIAFGGRGVPLASANWLVDIATGAAASEVVLVPDLQLGASSANDLIVPTAIWCPVPPIASGTRLAVRAACDITTATSDLDVVLYAFNVPAAGGGGGAVAYGYA